MITVGVYLLSKNLPRQPAERGIAYRHSLAGDGEGDLRVWNNRLLSIPSVGYH